MDNLIQRSMVLVVALVGIAAIATMVLVGRPTYHVGSQKATADTAQARSYSVAEVRQAFAAEGVRLRHSFHNGGEADGTTWLGTKSPPWPWASLYVSVAGPQAPVGPASDAAPAYYERFGNVDVHYGGSDPKVLADVQAAVAALR